MNDEDSYETINKFENKLNDPSIALTISQKEEDLLQSAKIDINQYHMMKAVKINMKIILNNLQYLLNTDTDEILFCIKYSNNANNINVSEEIKTNNPNVKAVKNAKPVSF